MPERVVAGLSPIALNLEPGTYSWCSCGRSKNQPFCDGSHNGPPATGCEPIELVIEMPKRCSLCTCKQSKIAPICDGTHKMLRDLVPPPTSLPSP